MSIRYRVVILLLVVLMSAVARPGAAQSAPVYNPVNGHWYQAVRVGSRLTWYQARDAAAALSYAGYPGHLVTITSAAENQFLISSVLPGGNDVWWLGGYQDRSAPDYSEPAGGWRWVTGEPWGYTNWHGATREPSNTGGNEDALDLAEGWGDQWNDEDGSYGLPTFIVEYEPGPLPGFARVAQLLLVPNAVVGGQSAAGQVMLSELAAPGGVVLALASSNPTAAVLPAAVTVPGGASGVTFPVITFPVASPTPVILSASGPGGTVTASLQVLPNASPPDNLLVNGSFEQPPVPPGSPHLTLGGPYDLPGWRILRGTVDVVAGDWQPAPDGGRQSLDLVGTPGAATIEQTFPTEPGRDYMFSGYVSHNNGVPFGRANVFLNGVFFVQLYQYVPSSPQEMHWTYFSYRFRATAATTTLSIADETNVDPNRGAALDGLSVTPALDQSPPPVTPAGPPPVTPAGSPGAAPAAPTGLTVTDLSATHVTLAWTDNSSNETAFAIWRQGGGRDWARVGLVAPNSTTFVDSGLTAGTTYTYRVRAINNSGPSDWTNEVTVTTLGTPQPPVPPPPPVPLVVPTPTNLTARVLPGFVPAGTVQLTWQDNSGGQATFAVWRRTAAGDWTQIAVLPPGTTSYLDPSLAPDVTYTYRVRAFRGGVASDWSNEASATALLLINGIPYGPSGPQETLAATFTQPDGGVTVNVYQGYVLLHVTGVGQAYANVYSDAFYLYSDQFSGSPQNGHDGGYYQLAFGTSPLGARDVGNDARNYLVGPLPPYNPAHDYTVVLNTHLASPSPLHFGVSDAGFSDNTGAYVITVTQLSPLP